MRLVVLAPGIDICKHRSATRDPDERFDFDRYEQLEGDMKREFGEASWWFDTSALRRDETAERLVSEATDRMIPLAAGWHTWLRRRHGL